MTARAAHEAGTLPALIAALDEQGSLDAVRARVARGDDPLAVIDDCRRGMQLVGEEYESGKYFISGLIMAGEIFREAMEILEPLLPAALDATPHGGASGVVLTCTVRGDIHDIGKSILVTLLRSHGHVVHDLGVDVPPAEVARRALEVRPDVVCLSGLLTVAHASMRETVAELRRVAPQLGHRPLILVGGGAVDEQVCRWSGADDWADDAMRGVELVRAHVADPTR